MICTTFTNFANVKMRFEIRIYAQFDWRFESMNLFRWELLDTLFDTFLQNIVQSFCCCYKRYF